MKRIVCLILSLLMLSGLAVALDEDTWSEWKELEPGLWHRTRPVPDVAGMVMEQRATGATVAELVMTEEITKGYGENGKLAWTSANHYNAQGGIEIQANYNYDENGVLSHGALTFMGADGNLEKIWALIITHNADGGFSTQIQEYDKDDALLAFTLTTYDKDGNFVSGSVMNMETKNNEAVDVAPAEDPIKDEWFKKLS